MKPNFALDLSHEGIGLLHRGADGWHTVGEVSLDDAEFTEKLGYLRQTAAALESGGVTTKLVIPNSQILFKTVEAKGPSEAERDVQIRAALDGTTPYEVDDLVYDWAVVEGAQDGTVRVAAVARETLVEAEAFANEHGFNPLSFVAIPENGHFSKVEPFFGVSKSADALLDDAQTVERDDELVRVLGPVAAPEPVAPPEVETTPEPEPQTEPEAPPQEPLVADALDIVPEPAPETEPEELSEQVQTPPAPLGDETDEAPADAPPEDSAKEPDLSGILSAELPELDVPASDIPIPTFSTRRDSGSTATTDQALDRIEKIESRLAILPEGTASLAPKLGGVSRKVVSEPEPDIPPPPPISKPPVATSPRVTIAPSEPAATTVADTMVDTGPPQPVLREDEEQAMTVFGARKKPKQRGKPRYLGLTLMLLLLAVLAAIVLWSSFFLNDKGAFWGGGQSDTPTAPTQTAIATSPNSVSDALAALTVPTITHTPEVQPAPEPEQIAAPTPLPVQPVALTPDTALAAYADSGIWQLAPKAPSLPRADEVQSLFVTSVDPQIASHDVVALPPVTGNSSDTSLETQASPAAYSVEFVLDERGLVIPSIEGTLTPDGVFVFAGPPPKRPRERGNRVPQVMAEVDTRLASFRPRARPTNLVQQNEVAQETEQLGGYTRAQLAAQRPPARPVAPKVVEERDETPTAQAVVLSSAPKHRPRNFAKVVARARTNASANAPREVATAAAAVPRNQTVAPSSPSRASVARLATTKNAINLRRTSLIGVYGSPSKRRALVRLSNGRYVKVKVGQRVDGGKVAAIGESELRYVKGGRTIILRMPKT